ncbi:TetR-like C-terminal domain-containing protein [Bradyrhizobium genosp. P]|uniref:TetR-like C-terminal domain-containing protein n=1 Tax=Bradyrhizobium genosp. P TaxID=83641 RepID=UPI003CE72BC2
MAYQDHSPARLSSSSWLKRLADDLAADVDAYTGETRFTVEEMRRFLAVKGYRELLQRMQAARDGKCGSDALRCVARAMRDYALERPALSVATFRTPTTDTPEWRAAEAQIREFMMSLFAECGLQKDAAVQAIRILRSIVRGFVIHEVMNSFFDPASYEESYECGIQLFIAGLQALDRCAFDADAVGADRA